MKKLISLTLSLLMAFNIANLPAKAEEVEKEPVDVIETEEQVEVETNDINVQDLADCVYQTKDKFFVDQESLNDLVSGFTFMDRERWQEMVIDQTYELDGFFLENETPTTFDFIVANPGATYKIRFKAKTNYYTGTYTHSFYAATLKDLSEYTAVIPEGTTYFVGTEDRLYNHIKGAYAYVMVNGNPIYLYYHAQEISVDCIKDAGGNTVTDDVIYSTPGEYTVYFKSYMNGYFNTCTAKFEVIGINNLERYNVEKPLGADYFISDESDFDAYINAFQLVLINKSTSTAEKYLYPGQDVVVDRYVDENTGEEVSAQYVSQNLGTYTVYFKGAQGTSYYNQASCTFEVKNGKLLSYYKDYSGSRTIYTEFNNTDYLIEGGIYLYNPNVGESSIIKVGTDLIVDHYEDDFTNIVDAETVNTVQGTYYMVLISETGEYVGNYKCKIKTWDSWKLENYQSHEYNRTYILEEGKKFTDDIDKFDLNLYDFETGDMMIGMFYNGAYVFDHYENLENRTISEETVYSNAGYYQAVFVPTEGSKNTGTYKAQIEIVSKDDITRYTLSPESEIPTIFSKGTTDRITNYLDAMILQIENTSTPKQVVYTRDASEFLEFAGYYQGERKVPTINVYATPGEYTANFVLKGTTVENPFDMFRVEFTIVDGEVDPIIGKWVQEDGNWYYYDENGNMVVQSWKLIKNVWYYFDKDGVMVTGYYEVKNVPYYFDEEGALVTGWKEVDGTWYYFTVNGALNGWQKIKNVWYYFDNYMMLENTAQEIGLSAYGFDENGAMVNTGWAQLGKETPTWYYAQPNGILLNGWQKINNVWYYFDNYKMLENTTKEIGNHTYRFDEKGHMVTGWFEVEDYYEDSLWYYYDENGAMVKGWQKIKDVWYFFTEEGIMCTGAIYLDENIYYLDESGALQIGWFELYDYWFYSNEKGELQSTTWIGDYYLCAEYAMVTSCYVYNENNGNYYWVDATGKYIPIWTTQTKPGEQYWIFDQHTGFRIQ